MSIAVTLVVAGVSYFISGPKLAIVCIVIGALIFLAIHFRGKKQEAERDAALRVEDSFTQTVTANPTINVHFGQPASVAEAPAILESAPDQVEESRPNITFLCPRTVNLHYDGY
jgi:heme/copper-type cytochrome/quinol oxidase subunit 2